jgi:hypothetical protein
MKQICGHALWRGVLTRMGKCIFLVTEGKRYVKPRDAISH